MKFCIFCFCVVLKTIHASEFSNTWVVKGDFTLNGLRNITEKLGFKVVSQLSLGLFVLSHQDVPRGSKYKAVFHTKRLASENKILFAEQEQWKKVQLRQNVIKLNDPKWGDMWYINEQQNYSMGILQAWKQGYSGKNIHISIVDDGVDHYHQDLSGKYEASSWDLYDGDSDPFVNSPSYNHGTKCAGVALATANNSICTAGVAYDARLVALRAIGARGVLPSDLYRAYTNGDVHISSNSFGGRDNEFDGPSSLVVDAWKRGVTDLRSGRGVIYVLAGGNGGLDDNCNTDGYVASIYTIGINSVSSDNSYPSYAEPCTAVLASAYSGGGLPIKVSTTDINQGCVSDFSGTSAATPMSAGIIALVLEANPNITWRDIQELIVRTSKPDVLQYGEFKTNAMGRKVSNWFGYGLLDAVELIRMAKSWTTLSEQHSCDNLAVVNGHVNQNSSVRVFQSTMETVGCNNTWRCVNSVEHVEVQVNFKYSLRGAIELTLQSPSGTISQLLNARNPDVSRNGALDWTFMSVHHWGENPVGTWKLNMSVAFRHEEGTLLHWRLVLYGTGKGCSKEKPGTTTSLNHNPTLQTIINSRTTIIINEVKISTQSSSNHLFTENTTNTIIHEKNPNCHVNKAEKQLVIIVGASAGSFSVVVLLVTAGICIYIKRNYLITRKTATVKTEVDKCKNFSRGIKKEHSNNTSTF